jgi:hypothetical protein
MRLIPHSDFLAHLQRGDSLFQGSKGRSDMSEFTLLNEKHMQAEA